MPKSITYPFEPTSITYLRAGQFWAVPLSDGRFGCGHVLHVPGPSDPELSLYLNTRIFLAGLMDWSGDEPPTAQAVAGCKLLEQGRAHVAAIMDAGSKILGQRDLELDGLSGLLQGIPSRRRNRLALRGRETPARRNRPGAADPARHISVGQASHRAAGRTAPGRSRAMTRVRALDARMTGLRQMRMFSVAGNMRAERAGCELARAADGVAGA